MTQEDKQLLIKDLSARLQYNVQVLVDMDKTFEGGIISTLKVINLKKDWVELESVLTPFKFDEIKPYLRPMTSMTEREKEEYYTVIIRSQGCSFENGESATTTVNDWLLSKHFDVRGLISKGLAIAVTKENNPYGNS